MNAFHKQQVGDPEIDTRIAAYEMAYRMQMSVPDLTDVSDEPVSTFELYGKDARIPGTHAANCLLARRLAERGVRFIQLYHRGWDHHFNLPGGHPKIAKEVDQGSAALVQDLKQRSMLDDTLVIREHLGEDPVAERLLRNMLRHATRDLNKPVAELPVDFGKTLDAIGYR